MIRVRYAEERGLTELRWLDSRHTFSFGDYYDAEHMGFGALRVINEDRLQPGGGFPMHGHRDMEILSVVLSGALEHRDSLGSGSVIHTGEVQRMSAGTGIRHSEFNPSATEPVHFLQIWIEPERTGLEPGYQQAAFPASGRRGRLQLLASRDGRAGSLIVHQPVDLYGLILAEGERLSRSPPGERAWVQLTAGAATINGERLAAGDGAALEGENRLDLEGVRDEAELIVFLLA